MLSPETWNFKPPQHNVSVVSGSCDQIKKVLTEISNHHLNHSVSIILPDTVLVPEYLNSQLMKDSTYYKINDFIIGKLLDKQFIESFVKSGKLFGLSIGTHIDTDDCAAVIPTGHLVLNLQKETYQTLGLQGVQSQYSSERFVVLIDLKSPSFTPGKKNYERTVRCLTELVKLQMDFIFAWDPPASDNGGSICPSSAAAYLSAKGCCVVSCSPRTSSSRVYGARLPHPTTSPDLMLEWLGAVALSVDIGRADSDGRYLSSYVGPPETDRECQVAVIKFQGFFTSNQLAELFKIFSSHVKKRQDVPFACMHVQGFADSPVSWGLKEHTFHSNGDNDYTILLEANQSFKVFKNCTFANKIKLKPC